MGPDRRRSAGRVHPNSTDQAVLLFRPVSLARLETVRLQLADGTEVPFERVFSDFQPAQGFFTPAFPGVPFDIRNDVYDAYLDPVLRRHDANGNGRMEAPEMAVLYLREGARGLGFDVTGVVRDGPVRALALTPADVGGLVSYVKEPSASLSPEARKLFRDLEFVGYNKRLKRGRRGQAAGAPR